MAVAAATAVALPSRAIEANNIDGTNLAGAVHHDALNLDSSHRGDAGNDQDGRDRGWGRAEHLFGRWMRGHRSGGKLS